jgi:hypothetical protein
VYKIDIKWDEMKDNFLVELFLQKLTFHMAMPPSCTQSSMLFNGRTDIKIDLVEPNRV